MIKQNQFEPVSTGISGCMNLKLVDNWHKWRYTSYTSGISLCDNSESSHFYHLGTIVLYQDRFWAAKLMHMMTT